jgi:hypothetical protein
MLDLFHDKAKALADLRHVYENLMNGGVRDTASAKRIAVGLLAPAIARLEVDQAALRELVDHACEEECAECKRLIAATLNLTRGGPHA